MTDDIVTRLRKHHEWFGNGGQPTSVWEDAADEIERLLQKEFMWKMTAVKLAGKMLPFSLLMNETEREEIQIVLQEAMNND